MAIAWERVAAPQDDGYDTSVALSDPPLRYKAPPVSAGPLVWTDGRARWASLEQMPSSHFQALAHDAPNVLAGLRLLALWPAIRRQCAELLVAVCPMTVGMQGGHGCSCGNYRDDFGWIYVTADDPWGFAEGVVHEMAHWKLRALGVWFEEWTDSLLLNRPDELYVSPVRKDITRPMGAVLHGQYSYIHVTEMVLRMLQAADSPSAADRDWLALQVRRITEGYDTLAEHARTTDAGAAFLSGVQAWTRDVLARCAAIGIAA